MLFRLFEELTLDRSDTVFLLADDRFTYDKLIVYATKGYHTAALQEYTEKRELLKDVLKACLCE
jgi:hypothetical protein